MKGFEIIIIETIFRKTEHGMPGWFDHPRAAAHKTHEEKEIICCKRGALILLLLIQTTN